MKEEEKWTKKQQQTMDFVAALGLFAGAVGGLYLGYWHGKDVGYAIGQSVALDSIRDVLENQEVICDILKNNGMDITKF